MQRLKTRAQFQAVLSGPALARTEHFALHRLVLSSRQTDGEADCPRLYGEGSSAGQLAANAAWVGAMVPKRWAKRAVTRNMIKRQIYTVTRLFELASGAAYVVRLRAGHSKTKFASATSAKLKAAVRCELEQLVGLSRSAKSADVKTVSPTPGLR